MKHSKGLTHQNLLAAVVVFVLLFVFLSSCSKKMIFGISPVVPAAKGSVIVKTDKNKNYSIHLKVTHLASPERLAPPRKEYVVWMETENGVNKNIGRLKSKSGILSKTMTGSLKTVATLKPEGFFITAEDDANTTYPSSMIVLRTN